MGLTADEAAEIIGTTRGYVYQLVHRGILPKRGPRQRNALDLADVERMSLERLDRTQPHPYWATRAEAAEMLGVSQKRVSQLVHGERIPGVQHAGRWYFRRHQLEVVANARDARRWQHA